MSYSKSAIDWPQELDRTPEDDRESTSKFSVNFQKTERQLRKEMDRMDVDEWRVSHVSGSHGDPGVVLRWTQNDVPYAVGCDNYTAKRDNLRTVYLWVEETRKRSDRPVVTGDTDFAAARLMPPGEDAEPKKPPHEVLGVAPDASDAVIEAAARARRGETHPDQGEDGEEFLRVNRAEEEMLDG